MTERFFGRKELFRPAAGVPQDITRLVPANCVGVIRRDDQELTTWLLAFDAGAVLDGLAITKQATELGADLARAKARLETCETSIAKLRTDKVALRSTLNAAEKRLREARIGSDAESATQLLTKLRSQLEKARQENAKLKEAEAKTKVDHQAEVAALQAQLQACKDLQRRLETANARLMKNIDDPSLNLPAPKSPKSALQAAHERGTEFGRRGLQGGLAGLEKK